MRRFKVHVQCGSQTWQIVELDDDETEDDLQETLREVAHDLVLDNLDWWFEEIKED